MVELFWLGFWIAVGFMVVSIGLTLILYAIFGLFYAGAWLLGKITGKDYL